MAGQSSTTNTTSTSTGTSTSTSAATSNTTGLSTTTGSSTASAQRVPPPTAVTAFLAGRPVWQVSYLSGLAAGVVTEIWGLAARAAGVPMKAAGLGSPHATAITVGMFALGTMVVVFWFTFVTAAVARFSRRPARLYVRLTVPLTFLSLLIPGTAADTAVSTKLVLAVAHLLAAAVIIPSVAYRLAQVTADPAA
ncbi:small-conductance mechanosensitive channel [Catenulispora sp. EB89]|uniref:DUF6069 family protein n=1 Tax=Catenulispora sp. EB89 TaxID=3156257 RepID=UPI00351612F4